MHTNQEILIAKRQYFVARLERSIARVIAATRREQRMSQADTAMALGWIRNEVANVERQRRRVAAAEIVLFAKVFEMDPELLWRRILGKPHS